MQHRFLWLEPGDSCIEGQSFSIHGIRTSATTPSKRDFKPPVARGGSLYGRLGGSAGLEGRSKRQVHTWSAHSARWGRTASLPIPINESLVDGAPTPTDPTHPLLLPEPGSILIWPRAGMGASAELCEWWKVGIKDGRAAARTPAGSAAALVGSFSPSRRQTPKVRPLEDPPLSKPVILFGAADCRP
ncbi:hypothetical protein CRENBAI_008693 [Crenichthys baileyi]|uniref:Uncharacterized protein n=1 Tax=Crenichthys baileyi TaxID=28760 RepID=A0AAV9RS41_9TELE